MRGAFIPTKTVVVIGAQAGRTEKFAARELAQEIRKVAGTRPRVISEASLDRGSARGKLLFILGTRKSSRLVDGLVSDRRCAAASAEQAYTMRTIPGPVASDGAAVVVTGADERGVLYGVRDLQHYYLEADAGRIVASRVNLQSAPKIKRRGAHSWDYYVADPFDYVDQLSRAKLNFMGVCPWRYIFEHDGIIPYAHERGVDVTWWDGLYSYHYVGFGNHNQWAILPQEAPQDIRRSPDRTCLCASDPKTIPWMTAYVLDVLEKMQGLDGVSFQTGNGDLYECRCDECRKFSRGEYFFREINPVIEAIAEKRPNVRMEYGVFTRDIYDEEFGRWISKVDRRAEAVLENRYPLGNAQDMDRLDQLVPHNYNLIGKLYGSRGQIAGWRERRWETTQALFESVSEAARRGVPEIGALVQTRLYSQHPLYIVNLYAEALWHGGAPPAKVLRRLPEISFMDQRVSDPPQQVARGAGNVWLIKYLNATAPDRWIPWPTSATQNICDLLSGGESASYDFRLPGGWKKGLRSVELVLQGAKDAETDLDSQYSFDVSVNGHMMRGLSCPWNKGGDVRQGRYENATEWHIEVPPKWLENRTNLTLHFLDKNGVVMYDRLALGLRYS